MALDPQKVIDQSFPVTITGGPRNGDTIWIDLQWLRMTLDELYNDPVFAPRVMSDDDAQLEPGYEEGMVYREATPEFSGELARRIAVDHGYCSRSMAVAIWHSFHEMVASLKKSIAT